MAIAVRERTGELAVLMAVGYADRFVLRLVLAESMLIAAVGGAIGPWLARGMTARHSPPEGLRSDGSPSRSADRSAATSTGWS